MAAMFQGCCSETTLTITTEFGQWELPNDQDMHNTKSLSSVLRACCDPQSGKSVCTFQHIADALGYHARQDPDNFWREFTAVHSNTDDQRCAAISLPVPRIRSNDFFGHFNAYPRLTQPARGSERLPAVNAICPWTSHQKICLRFPQLVKEKDWEACRFESRVVRTRA